jgi:hypothetical protein
MREHFWLTSAGKTLMGEFSSESESEEEPEGGGEYDVESSDEPAEEDSKNGKTIEEKER